MKIVHDFPPNIDKIAAVFPTARGPRTIFAYGDRVYMPGGGQLTPALTAHEEVHCRAQLAMGVEWWWHNYLTDVAFRFAEEARAHEVEWRKFNDYIPMPNRAQRRQMLKIIAERLSGPLYGRMISYDEARKLLLGIGEKSR